MIPTSLVSLPAERPPVKDLFREPEPLWPSFVSFHSLTSTASPIALRRRSLLAVVRHRRRSPDFAVDGHRTLPSLLPSRAPPLSFLVARRRGDNRRFLFSIFLLFRLDYI
ncbi:hypothetical protein MA16_Dca008894 [Dendrobium catenatum]|uniref:Uncharacterized protein n=1 Tax=Dendrobium catenatum TaxID=906689 RepID=A0A2I0VUM0_9ASPA|nr:hypothetical protein MA16_Dca008894 [Dendrobium catenatum]